MQNINKSSIHNSCMRSYALISKPFFLLIFHSASNIKFQKVLSAWSHKTETLPKNFFWPIFFSLMFHIVLHSFENLTKKFSVFEVAWSNNSLNRKGKFFFFGLIQFRATFIDDKFHTFLFLRLPKL